MAQKILRPEGSIIVCNQNNQFNYSNDYYKKTLFVGNQLTGEGIGLYRTLLNFNLSEFTADSQIISAKLCFNVVAAETSQIIDVYNNPSAPYDASKVNFKDQPLGSSVPPVNITPIAASGAITSPTTPDITFVSIDITTGFKNWLLATDKYVVNGVTLAIKTENTTNASLIQIDNSNSSPYIVVDYINDKVHPATDQNGNVVIPSNLASISFNNSNKADTITPVTFNCEGINLITWMLKLSTTISGTGATSATLNYKAYISDDASANANSWIEFPSLSNTFDISGAVKTDELQLLNFNTTSFAAKYLQIRFTVTGIEAAGGNTLNTVTATSTKIDTRSC